jgi:DNA-binding XRE family transcriptional regulator
MVENLGLVISKYRNMRNLSQEKLADLVGVSRQAIVNWEENKSKPSLLNFEKISEKLQIPVGAVTGTKEQFEVFDEVDLGDGIVVIFARQK